MLKPAQSDEPSTDGPPIELLGPGSYLPMAGGERAATNGGASDETIHRRPPRLPPIVVAVIVLAAAVIFGLLSRPPSPPSGTDEDPDRSPAEAEPGNGGAGDRETAAERDLVAQRLAMRDIPAFDDSIPGDLPGVLSGIDDRGSFVVIDRRAEGPVERALGPAVAGSDRITAARLGIVGAPLIRLDGEIRVDGHELVSTASGVRRQIDLSEVVPDLAGSVLVVSADGSGATASATSLDGDGGAEPILWELSGPEVEVLGLWRDALLVRRGAHTWLLEEGGGSRLVTSEQVLTFDGRNLSVLACPRLDQCRIEVGPPDDVQRRSIPLPESLARLAPSAWTTSLAISPDGSHLAASVAHGALSLPMVIDLDTGESLSLADGMNRQAPVAWSPDGQWLAYVYTDDVMVWPITGERSWRITLDRQLDVLLWR
jgi:hypothetical protein